MGVDAQVRLDIVGLHAKQLEASKILWSDGTRGVFLNGGAASGKTLCGCLNLREAITRGAREIAFVGPTWRHIGQIIEKYAGLDGTKIERGPGFKLLRALVPGSWNQTTHIYRTDEGAVIYFFGGNEKKSIERFASIHPSYIWVDEFGVLPQYSIDIIMERLGTNPNSKILTTSTPYYADGRYRKLIQSPPDGFHVVQMPSGCNAARFPPGEIERLRKMLPDWLFRLKYMGEFTRAEGLVFEIPDEQRIEEPSPTFHAERYYGGIDWGRTNAFVLVAANRLNQLCVLAEYWNDQNLPTDKLAQAIWSTCQGAGVDPGYVQIYADSAEPDRIEIARKNGLNARKAEKPVQQGIARVQMALKSGMTVMRDCTHLLEECDLYSYKEDSDDPVKAFDHAPDALRYCLMGIPYVHLEPKKRRSAIGETSKRAKWVNPFSNF